MKEKGYIGPNQRLMELWSMSTYEVHLLCMFLVAISQQWELWVDIVFVLALVVPIIVFFAKPMSYERREVIYHVMVLAGMLLFSFRTDQFICILFPFSSVVVLMGLCNIIELSYISSAAFAILVFYHSVVHQNIVVTDFDSFNEFGIPILNVMLIQFVIWFWVRMRNQSGARTMHIIEELRTAESTKDDFLANVSHEIRTPINTINGMSEVILQEPNPAQIRENVYHIQNAGRNLMSVVSDILDFSELSSGKMDIVEEAYNITSTINDIISMSMAQKSKKNLEFLVDIDPNLPCGLVGDEKKIRRVITNLVNNAIKFTDEGGVSLEVGFRKEQYGINLLITVKDTGIGMNSENLEKLFTTYNQADMSRNRQKGGVGLGLAISNAIVKGMGGVITVRSRLGVGTSVRVVIPQKVRDAQPIAFIKDKDQVRLAVYIDMEKFPMRDVRDAYARIINHMMVNFEVQGHMCRSFEELRRRQERDHFSYIFIGLSEYLQAPGYYKQLYPRTKTVVLLDRENDSKIENPEILRIYKPLYVVPVANCLNGYDMEADINALVHKQSFVAPSVKVLVVDDNEMNIRVARALLDRYQIKVVQALSGMEALEKIESKDFDFIFMDHMMPEMDGIEALKRIRQKGGSYYANVPAIALTANAIAGAREMFLAEGFADFVEKPIENAVLERVLRRNIAPEKIVPIEQEPAAEKKLQSVQVEEKATEEATVEATVEAAVEEVEEAVFAVGDLDVEKGEMYCGGHESYLMILQEYAKKGNTNWEPIEKLFAEEDWKNYVISVHAVKSSMLAIGASHLSEMAKKLEFAGKENNISYIQENHAEMIAEYKRVIGEIIASPFVSKSSGQTEAEVLLPAIAEDEFAKLITEFEDAVYAFDEAVMLRLLERLAGCSYCGANLEEEVLRVRHKIEMSDYMSALESLGQLKERLKKERGEG